MSKESTKERIAEIFSEEIEMWEGKLKRLRQGDGPMTREEQISEATRQIADLTSKRSRVIDS